MVLSLLNRRRLQAFVALAIATGGATPADAQWTSSSTLASVKNEAILGGAPSRLAAILAAQSNATGTQPILHAPFAPSAALTPFTLAPFAPNRVQPAAPVSTDRPDVFNSVAIQVSHTSLDRRWSAVAHSSVGGSAGAYAGSLAGTSERNRVEAVNAYVNRRVSFVDDSRRFGIPDRWSAASETLNSGRGDCEDYALAKMAMLRRAGLADRNLYLVVLKDLVRRADHAVLVVRSEGRFLVLDNGTDRVLDSSEIRDYRPVLTFTAGKVYTHGYRREAVPPVTYAKAEPTAPIYTAAAPAFAALASASLPMSMFAAGGGR